MPRQFSLLLLLLFLFAHLRAQDMQLLGLNYQRDGLRFSHLNLTTGQYETEETKINTSAFFQQGECTYDAANGIYYFTRGTHRSAQIIAVDADDGQVISQQSVTPNGTAIVPLANLVFHPEEEVIYGLQHTFDGQETLRLARWNPQNGQYEILSEAPISRTPYLSANGALINGYSQYCYATAKTIYTVDLGNGLTQKVNISYPSPEVAQYLVNLVYHSERDALYGLYFRGGRDAALFLCEVDPKSGQLAIISSTSLGGNGFNMGDAAIDPVRDAYYYQLQGTVYEVDIESGAVQQEWELPKADGVVMPLINFIIAPQPEEVPLVDQAATSPTLSSEAITSTVTAPQASLQLFPNPTTRLINYQLEGLDSVDGQLELFDLQGRLLWAARINMASGQVTLPVKESGQYVLRFQQGEVSLSERVVVEKR